MKQTVKGKWVSFIAMMLLLIWTFPAFAAETQTISIDPATATKNVGDDLSIAVNYSITNDAVSKGIQVRVHYDSKKLTFVSFTNVYAANKLGEVNAPQDDTVNDYDNDPNTDKQVNITWTEFSGNWPGDARLLFNANFKVNDAAYNGVTAVNLSNPQPAPGFSVEKTGLALTVTGGKDAPATPVLTPGTGFYNNPVSVTATVDPAPVVTYYTTDGTDPDETDTVYAGAFNVDGADGDVVTVKMRSYDAGEPIWGDVGSAVYTFDKAAPTGTITTPAADAYVIDTALNIAGTASDGGSGIDKVEVSIDGGTSYKAAEGTTSWTYAATLKKGANDIKVRIHDKAGNTTEVAGNKITYFPALSLWVDGEDMTGKTIFVPNTAGNNTKTVTVKGGSEAFGTYTWTVPNFGTLPDGASADKKVYTATIGATGTDTITVQDPVDPAVFTANIQVNVIAFSVTSDNATPHVGETIVFTAQGNTGDVVWEVKTGADVAGELEESGTQNNKATVTPTKAGKFIISATDSGTDITFDHAEVTVFTKPDFGGLPTEEITVLPGQNSAEFEISGGDGTYNWTVVGPQAVPGAATAKYTFTAPAAGEFAGKYTVTAAGSGGYTQSFDIYVPLMITPEKTVVTMLSTAAPYPFTLTGAANTTPYTVVIDSHDDNQADIEVPGVFAANTATYAFDPADYTVTTDTGAKGYSLEFDVHNYTNPPMVDITIYPVVTKDFEGTLVDKDDLPIAGATVVVTAPAGFKGLTQTTNAQGEFKFTVNNLYDITVLGFRADAPQYISKTFTSKELDNPVKLDDAGASVNVNAGAQAQVVLYDKDGKVSGPMDTTAAGAFTFQFSAADAYPMDYTVTASAPGVYGSATFTADAANYTPVVNVAMAAVVPPAGYAIGADSRGGGEVDLTAATTDADVMAAFGGNPIKLVIAPVQDGNPIGLAPPVAKNYTDTSIPVSKGVQWEIEDLDDNCVTVPVPCTHDQAVAVANGTKVVYYENSDAPGVWNVVTVDPSRIFYNGDESLIEVDICDWSANVVGIGNAPAGPGAGGSSSSTCFISSLGGNGTSHVAWIAMIAVLALAVVFSTIRRQRMNG